MRKNGEQQDSRSFYNSFLAALCRGGHIRNGVLFKVDAASSMQRTYPVFIFFVCKGPLSHMYQQSDSFRCSVHVLGALAFCRLSE